VIHPPHTLPDGLTAYKRTSVFDEDSIPAGLRHEHRTKEGVWALIHVLEGQLLYRSFAPHHEQVLTPTTPGIVQPQQPHEVKPVGAVRFFVEFHSSKPPLGEAHIPAIPGEKYGS
jgi:tellurite methyltransferase